MADEAALKNTADDTSMSLEIIDIKAPVRQYVQENFYGASPQRVADGTPLITSGIIDSIGMIGLVAFIEERFKIEFQPTEINAQGLDTLDRIEALVRRKLEPRP